MEVLAGQVAAIVVVGAVCLALIRAGLRTAFQDIHDEATFNRRLHEFATRSDED
jgi:hypothetical protein